MISLFIAAGGEAFLYFQSNKERDMRQLITLPMGELIPAKQALPEKRRTIYKIVNTLKVKAGHIMISTN